MPTLVASEKTDKLIQDWKATKIVLWVVILILLTVWPQRYFIVRQDDGYHIQARYGLILRYTSVVNHATEEEAEKTCREIWMSSPFSKQVVVKKVSAEPSVNTNL